MASDSSQTTATTNKLLNDTDSPLFLSLFDQSKYRKWLFRSFEKCSRNKNSSEEEIEVEEIPYGLWIMEVIMVLFCQMLRCNMSNKFWNSPVPHECWPMQFIYLFSATCFGAIIEFDWIAVVLQIEIPSFKDFRCIRSTTASHGQSSMKNDFLNQEHSYRVYCIIV